MIREASTRKVDLMAMTRRQRTGGDVEEFAFFTRAMTWTAGGLAIITAAVAVVIGLMGDTVLNDSAAELWIVAGITVVAAVFLAAPWSNVRIRAVGLGVSALAYHIVLSRSWLPWIEHYTAHTGLGSSQAPWEEAIALPLLMAAGLLLVVAALFAWPASRAADS